MGYDGEVVIKIGTDTKDFTKEIARVEDKLDTLEKEYDALKKASPYENQTEDLIKYEAEIEKTRNQIITLQQKQLALNKEDFKNVRDGIDGIGSSITKTIKKIGKWALAVFSIRSAYMAVRRAASTVAEYNDQIKSDLDYIQFALSSALQPIIEFLISAVLKLLDAIGLMVYKLTGVDIFAESTAKSFSNANKSVKEIKKNLAGFDEMNVLGSQNSTAQISPSFSLGGYTDKDTIEFSSKWKKTLEDFKNNWFETIDTNEKYIEDVLANGGWTDIFITSVGNAIEGAELTIGGLIDTVAGVGEIIEGIVNGDANMIVAGIRDIIFGLIEFIGGAMGTILSLIVGLLGQVLYEIGIGLYSIGSFILQFINNSLKGYFGSIYDIFTSPFKLAYNYIKSVFKSIIQIAQGDLKGGLSTAAKGIGNIFIDVINIVIKSINAVVSPIRALIVALGKVTGKGWTMDNIKIPTFPRLAVGGIINMPGKGVYTGGAIAGEAGKEGVIPLTNSQAMEQLGESIGKYISVNFTNITKLDNRVIAREQRNINQQQDFAYNR